MGAGAVLEELAALTASLLDVPLCAESSVGLVDMSRQVARVRNLLAAFETVQVAELELRRCAGDYARQTTTELLVATQTVNPAHARAAVSRAEALGPRVSLQGEALPPLLPRVAEACAAGAVSAEQAAVIIGCADRIPAGAGPEALDIVQAVLLEAAEHEYPRALQRTAAELLNRLDPDGAEPRERELERRRDLSTGRDRSGSGRWRARTTPECQAVWDAILDSLAAPAPAEDGDRDDRTPGQRRHDGLLEAGYRLLRSGTLPDTGGVPVTVLIRTTLDDLDAALQRCSDSSGGDGTAGGGADADAGARSSDVAQSAARGRGRAALRGHAAGLSTRDDLLPLAALLACGDAQLVPVLFDLAGAPLALGRTQRLASPGQRRALALRDGGCSFPGCDRPPAWTEVHHVQPWKPTGAGQAPGRTDIDNLTLLCRHHHRVFERRGWTVIMRDGRPEWIPPAWLDPEQKPHRNRAHHPPDLTFAHPDTSTSAHQCRPKRHAA